MEPLSDFWLSLPGIFRDHCEGCGRPHAARSRSGRNHPPFACHRCWGSFRRAPPLCPRCLIPLESHDPDGACAAHAPSDPIVFESVHSRLLGIGGSWRMLRAWKTRGSRSHDRALVADARPPQVATPGRLLLVPVPQQSMREANLRGGSSWRLADALARRWKAEAIDGLGTALRAKKTTRFESAGMRQAQRGLEQRLTLPPRFELKPPLLSRLDRFPKTIDCVIVDDFLTSGETLRAAADAIRRHPRSGGIRLYAWTLGFRPSTRSASASPFEEPESS